MPQHPYSGVVQPQNSMTEALPTITLRVTIDRTARSCRASNESRSSELLLVLHTLFEDALLCCAAETDELGRTIHAARCKQRLDGYMQTCHEGVPVKELASAGDGRGPSQRIRAFPTLS